MSKPIPRWPLLAMAACLAGGCYDESRPLPQGDWELVSTHQLSVPEPSGLCLDPDGRSLWTVSDETGLIYRIDLEGRSLQTLPFNGEDLEGIALDAGTGGFWLAEERRRQLLRVNRAGVLQERYSLDLPGAANSGLEGVSVDDEGRVLLVNEKNPGRLLRFEPASGAVEAFDLDFARDYSGLFWDSQRQGLWVLSDESQALYLLREGQSPVEYRLGLARLEGVAVAGDTAWVVSDALSKLFRIQLN
jgi:uncharacterized protein YjiK